MAATDQTYRKIPTLHVVFGVTCIVLLVSVLWMMVQDYNRPFKQQQRLFRDVETARGERLMLEALPTSDDLGAKVQAVKDARDALAKAQDDLRSKERELSGKREIKDVAYRTAKAEYDSKASYYDGAVEEGGKITNQGQKQQHDEELAKKREELDKLRAARDQAKNEYDGANETYKREVTDKLKGPREALENAEDDLKKTTGAFDRLAKTTALKRWKISDSVRDLPVVDGFASPIKISQIVLNDLTIDYGGFRDVPRYDRCTTCHLAIDRANFDKASLAKLTKADPGLEGNLKQARELLYKRQRDGEDLGFDPGDLPSKVTTVKMTEGQITQYAAHPRLDLFVDSNSPHPMQKFGCTICHQGQGSATEFTLASHTPNDTPQTAEWQKHHDWHAIHDWDFPMYAGRFLESSCLKCHHQVTDLVRGTGKEEAPKLLRGYNLVKENGCFGCHEIAGIKGGRPVGPDLRLEPTPALEWLSTADQDRAKADALNPPGTMRKVGPSLRRLSEKTNESWTRKWIQAPRNFREDTKMPHFYGLSNNSPETLPDDQKKFPDAEIHAITAYLFHESRAHLKGADTTRATLEATVADLQGRLEKGPLPDKDRKDLLDASRNFANLALLSAPMSASKINALAAEQRQLQDRVQQLRRREAELGKKKEELDENDKKDLEESTKKLNDVTAELIAAAKPIPLEKRVIDADGVEVSADVLAKKGDPKHGRRLFTERGCLACHADQATEKAGDGFVAVKGEANFGPNLSRLAQKLGPDKGDDLAKKRWLVQWLLNPNVHHPRTRMPVTFLKPADANDLAEWLLSNKGDPYEEKDPEEPSVATLIDMARMSLLRMQGMTAKDVDKYLPRAKGDDELPPGITDKPDLPRDADEQALVPAEKDGKVSRDKLLWYIGRKSITRLGCYACHDLPGFEQAKPIGTALNDWGKKDPERLAFEDADAFVKSHFNIVPTREAPKEAGKDVWKARDNKEPYEQYFADALEHHRREGFLSLKLAEPRSYDYKRLRAYDDRLRMPQFQFARPRRLPDEDDEAYEKRKSREEAEAREAVMTFVLGLVADPIPLKYVNAPGADKAAEVRGRQVLEKFNCAGCHQLQPGMYEFKPSPKTLEALTANFDTARSNGKTDHFFGHSNAWAGTPSPHPDRLIAFGTPRPPDDPDEKPTTLDVRLAEALRFTDAAKNPQNIPAANLITIPVEDVLAQQAPEGGTLVNLLIPYVNKAHGERLKGPDDARSALPPPLVREGERVQPKWLYQFLLNPQPVRPEPHMLLRMPRFNMSGEESQALVNYFAATAKTQNPGVGLTYPYLFVEQREKEYWARRNGDYVKELKKDKLLDDRAKALEPYWKADWKAQLADLEASAAALKGVKDKEAEHKALEEKIKDQKAKIDKADFSQARQDWEKQDAYAVDAYRVLTNKELCLKCHDIGGTKVPGASGPPLDLAAERLRPEWTLQWIANPKRLFTYDPIMPQNFPSDKKQWQEQYHGTSFEQARAVRDALMDLPRLADLPANRARPAAEGK